MDKKSAMSAMGYAIVSVIVLALVMIISAPMLVNNGKEVKNTNSEPVVQYETQDDSQLKSIEERLSSRIDNLERRETVSNRYVCSIEGKVDENGEVITVECSGSSGNFVFVCEYKQ